MVLILKLGLFPSDRLKPLLLKLPLTGRCFCETLQLLTLDWVAHGNGIDMESAPNVEINTQHVTDAKELNTQLNMQGHQWK